MTTLTTSTTPARRRWGAAADTIPVPPLAPWEGLPARQQPRWRDHPAFRATRAMLNYERPLVTVDHVWRLREELARVALGEARLVQLGDCAESLAECGEEDTRAKIAAIDRLAEELEHRTGDDVVRVGRLGGQFAKPRSQDVELHQGRELPAFRGHLVNGEQASPEARRHDPRRLLRAYRASAEVMRVLTAHRAERAGALADLGPWASHEALVLDYEGNLVREDPTTGTCYLGSTHLPWVGERTRQPRGAHVRLLSAVANPVGCKIGPDATPAEVVETCGLLDPERRPGRLVLISRMGKDRVTEILPPIVDAVRAAGHPVVWLIDPMHGNTTRTNDGLKTRYLDDIRSEALLATRVLRECRAHPAGLHLEVAATEVTECVGGPISDERRLSENYTTLCDPRLNPTQARRLVEAWARS